MSEKIRAKYLSPKTTEGKPAFADLVPKLGRLDTLARKQSIEILLGYENQKGNSCQEGIIYLDHAEATELGTRLIELAARSRRLKG